MKIILIHFILDAYHDDKENQSILSDDFDVFTRNNSFATKPIHRSRPTTSNGDKRNDILSDSKVTQTEEATENLNSITTNNLPSTDESRKENDKMMVELEKPNDLGDKVQLLRGLLFVEQMRVTNKTPRSEYFINYDGFWSAGEENSNTSTVENFCHLKVLIRVISFEKLFNYIFSVGFFNFV